jgi:hypothetical protein
MDSGGEAFTTDIAALKAELAAARDRHIIEAARAAYAEAELAVALAGSLVRLSWLDRVHDGRESQSRDHTHGNWVRFQSPNWRTRTSAYRYSIYTLVPSK